MKKMVRTAQEEEEEHEEEGGGRRRRRIPGKISFYFVLVCRLLRLYFERKTM